MTDKEFHTLCNTMKIGTPLSFATGEEQINGTFAGCTNDDVVIEVHGQYYIWPPDLIDADKPDYPPPAYS